MLVSGVVQSTPDKLRSSYSVMTYHKEGPACGKIPCDPTSSEADCEYPVDPNAERLKKNRNGFKDIDMKKNFEHKISRVLPESIAEELEIEPGDVLLAVNDQPIEDVFDYHYYTNEEYLTVLIRKPDGKSGSWRLKRNLRRISGLSLRAHSWMSIDPAGISVSSALLTRCRLECVRPSTLKMTIPDCLSCRGIM